MTRLARRLVAGGLVAVGLGLAPPDRRTSEAASGPCEAPVDGDHRVDLGGVDRQYVTAAPNPDDVQPPWPVIIGIHGTGGSAAGFGDRSGLALEALAAGALVVLPQGGGDPAGWLSADRAADARFLDAVYDATVDSGCIDADRVWIAGLSAGSAFAGSYACTRPGTIGGAVLVAALPPSCDEVTAAIYVVHGTADDIIPYGGGDFNGTELATMPEVAAGWADAAGCGAVPSGRGIEPDVFVLDWSGCGDAEGVVRLYSVIGGGHGWFSDGAAAVDATCLVVTGATTEVGDRPDMSACEG